MASRKAIDFTWMSLVKGRFALIARRQSALGALRLFGVRSASELAFQLELV